MAKTKRNISPLNSQSKKLNQRAREASENFSKLYQLACETGLGLGWLHIDGIHQDADLSLIPEMLSDLPSVQRAKEAQRVAVEESRKILADLHQQVCKQMGIETIMESQYDLVRFVRGLRTSEVSHA